VKVLALRKLSHQGLEPQIKSLNYLNNVMGKLEAWDAGYDEGMFLDEAGYACECPGFNILGLKGKTLFTPSRGILVGITRGTVMEMARDAARLDIQTGFYTVFDFTTARRGDDDEHRGDRPGDEPDGLDHRQRPRRHVDDEVAGDVPAGSSRVATAPGVPEAWRLTCRRPRRPRYQPGRTPPEDPPDAVFVERTT
jgi:hypothetical protein